MKKELSQFFFDGFDVIFTEDFHSFFQAKGSEDPVAFDEFSGKASIMNQAVSAGWGFLFEDQKITVFNPGKASEGSLKQFIAEVLSFAVEDFSFLYFQGMTGDGKAGGFFGADHDELVVLEQIEDFLIFLIAAIVADVSAAKAGGDANFHRSIVSYVIIVVGGKKEYV